MLNVKWPLQGASDYPLPPLVEGGLSKVLLSLPWWRVASPRCSSPSPGGGWPLQGAPLPPLVEGGLSKVLLSLPWWRELKRMFFFVFFLLSDSVHSKQGHGLTRNLSHNSDQMPAGCSYFGYISSHVMHAMQARVLFLVGSV